MVYLISNVTKLKFEFKKTSQDALYTKLHEEIYTFFFLLDTKYFECITVYGLVIF